MGIKAFRSEEWIDAAAVGKPVPEPLGDPVSRVRSQAENSTKAPRTRFGAWDCSPGTWRRQVKQAEFCHFLAGEATFVPDQGEPVVLRAGDTAYFPEGSGGVWTITAQSRKVFVTFDETLDASR